jgi:hypothetical protein
MVPFLRSIRTTGCQARIVVIAGDRAIAAFSKGEKRILRQCGADLISFGYMIKFWWEQDLLLRFSVYFDWLYHHQKAFERVLFVQMHIVMFQGDPFNSDLADDAVFFVDEGVGLDKAAPELTDFLKLKPKQSLYKGRPLVTDNIFGGGVQHCLVFLDIYLTYLPMVYDEFDKVTEHTYFLLCYYTFAGSSKRLNTKLLGPNNGIVGLRYYSSEKGKESPGYYKTKDGVYPSTINHFTKSHKFRYDVYGACPRGRLNSKNYMAMIPEAYMNGTIDRTGRLINPDEEQDADD